MATDATPNDDRPRDEREIVTFERPRCPECNSLNLKTNRTVATDGDGVATRDTRCRACGIRFFVIAE